MKLKILIAPLAIVAMIILIVWGIMPAYSDYQQKKAALGADTAKLVDVQGKKANVDNLFKELSASTDQQDTLLKYMPSSMQEETVIDNISSLASGANLAVYGLAVKTDERANSGASVLASAVAGQASPSQDAPSDFAVTVGVSGDYQNIKNFLGKLTSLDRYAKIDSLDMQSVVATSTSANGQTVPVQTGNIKADMELTFAYLGKADSVPDFSKNIFSTGRFDMSTIQDIKTKATTALASITADAAGKSDPFTP